LSHRTPGDNWNSQLSLGAKRGIQSRTAKCTIMSAFIAVNVIYHEHGEETRGGQGNWSARAGDTVEQWDIQQARDD
jgi:hypothetical protein